MGIPGRSYTRESKSTNSTWHNFHAYAWSTLHGHISRECKRRLTRSQLAVDHKKGQPLSLNSHHTSLKLTRAPPALNAVVLTERFSAHDDFFHQQNRRSSITLCDAILLKSSLRLWMRVARRRRGLIWAFLCMRSATGPYSNRTGAVWLRRISNGLSSLMLSRTATLSSALSSRI